MNNQTTTRTKYPNTQQALFCSLAGDPLHEDPELIAIAEQYGAELRYTPGAPPTYSPRYFPRMAYILTSEHGMTNEQLAAVFCVKPLCLHVWMRKHEEFKSAIQRGRDEFNVGKVEVGLVKRAVGYELLNQKKARVPIYDTYEDDNGKKHRYITGYEMAIVEETVQHIPPDVNAIRFLLQNRDKDRWEDVRRIEARGRIEHAHAHIYQHKLELDPSQLTTEQLESLLKEAGNPDPLLIAEMEGVEDMAEAKEVA